MIPIPLTLVVEDDLSEAVLKRILSETGSFAIGDTLGKKGNGYIRKRISGLNDAAQGIPFFVLIDLDRFLCVPSLLLDYLPHGKRPNLIFRVAVKEVEAWLLADKVNVASFLGVPESIVPNNVEAIFEPKECLINLARRSRKRIIREDIVPLPGSTSKIGRNYNGCLMGFVSQQWNITNASRKSESLRRALFSLRSFRPVW